MLSATSHAASEVVLDLPNPSSTAAGDVPCFCDHRSQAVYTGKLVSSVTMSKSTLMALSVASKVAFLSQRKIMRNS